MPAKMQKEVISAEFLEGFKHALIQLTQPSGYGYQKTLFHTRPMVVEMYATKLVPKIAEKYNAQAEDLMYALILIDRLSYSQPAYALCQETLHRLFVVALVVSMKVRHDVLFNNKVYASNASIALADFNALECKFLNELEFDVHVEVEDFETYCSNFARMFDFGGALDEYIVACCSSPRSTASYCDAMSSAQPYDVCSVSGSFEQATPFSAYKPMCHSMSMASLDSWDQDYSQDYSQDFSSAHGTYADVC